jgi:DNA gyrase subunit A
MLMTANGMMVRTPVDQVRVIGRNTQGVRLINLEEGDTLLEAVVVPADPNGDADANGAGEANGETAANATDAANGEDAAPAADAGSAEQEG